MKTILILLVAVIVAGCVDHNVGPSNGPGPMREKPVTIDSLILAG